MSYSITSSVELNHTSTTPGRKNDRRFIRLVSHLEKIRTSVRWQDAESAMTAFTTDLLQLSAPQQLLFSYQHVTEVFVCSATEDEAVLFYLEYHGAAIATILNTMDRFLTRGISPEFFHSATLALIYLACQNQHRCRSIYIQGGVREITRMMDRYRSVNYIQIIGIAALMVIGKVVLGEPLGKGTCKNLALESTLLLQILEAVEWNQECPRVYVVACSAFASLFGPGSKVFVDGGELENHIYHRALYAITYGLIVHVDDAVAQRVGTALLGTMVGTDVAQEMISEVERNHCSTCSAAAA